MKEFRWAIAIATVFMVVAFASTTQAATEKRATNTVTEAANATVDTVEIGTTVWVCCDQFRNAAGINTGQQTLDAAIDDTGQTPANATTDNGLSNNTDQANKDDGNTHGYNAFIMGDEARSFAFLMDDNGEASTGNDDKTSMTAVECDDGSDSNNNAKSAVLMGNGITSEGGARSTATSVTTGSLVVRNAAQALSVGGMNNDDKTVACGITVKTAFIHSTPKTTMAERMYSSGNTAFAVLMIDESDHGAVNGSGSSQYS